MHFVVLILIERRGRWLMRYQPNYQSNSCIGETLLTNLILSRLLLSNQQYKEIVAVTEVIVDAAAI